MFELETRTIPLHRKIEKARCNLEGEYQNNRMISLIGVDTVLSDDDEQKLVTVRYMEVEYKLFAKTLMLWNMENHAFNLNQILSEYRLDSEFYPIPNAMGMAFMVITSDNKLLFTKRSGIRRIRPNEYDCSIVEGLKPEVISATESYDYEDERYVLYEAKRAFREEICADDSTIKVKLTGIVLDKEYGQWNIIGTISAGISSEDIMRRHAVRNDTYEQNVLEFVPFVDANGQKSLTELKQNLKKYLQGKMWGMALVVLYTALRDVGFTDAEIKELSRI